MLKWSVLARREADKSDSSRLTSATPGNIISDENFSAKAPKRRHSNKERRSAAARRSLGRNSLDLDVDKENQFTSTPIKPFEDHHHLDVLKDVGNLTPKDTANSVRLHAKKSNSDSRFSTSLSRQKHKKKKDCLKPTHRRDLLLNSDKNYVAISEIENHEIGVKRSNLSIQSPGVYQASPFHIASSSNYHKPVVKKPKIDNYVAISEIENHEIGVKRSNLSIQSSGVYQASPFHVASSSSYHRNDEPVEKKPKIDHVSDFLNQICIVTSPEDDASQFTTMEVKSNMKAATESVNVSPLVKKFVDLRFSQISYDNKHQFNSTQNNSSYINELSLDKIVDAILDSSDSKITEDLNSGSGNQTFLKANCSSDSGFTSSKHQLEGNFTCKCNNNNNNNNELSDVACNKTIINLNETFNERCVDEMIKPRKRTLEGLSEVGSNPKRFYLDTSDHDNINFTLKRRRCIRRRKLEGKAKNVPTKMEHPAEFESFNSSDMSAEIGSDNKSTPITSPRLITETPVDRINRRFRRCLLFNSPTSTKNRDMQSQKGGNSESQGSIDLSIVRETNHLYVNVIPCEDIQRIHLNPINANAKVALNDTPEVHNRRNNNYNLLQSRVLPDDFSKPFFNHSFKFPIQNQPTQKELHIEVWHRDRNSRSSEFLGCMTFDAKNAFKKDVNGLYRLLPRSTGRCPNAPITHANSDSDNVCRLELDVETAQATMCESQSSVDELMSLEDLDNDLKRTSSKAILGEQQKYADENLFLRYLELDPMEGPEAIPAAMQRKATGNKNGRTPFTQTKKLTRAPKSGFGFSVVWTHPPRIERVEKGLPAERAGILPGDYIIFVDKHNVVMMPEIDILNLIRSYGSQLTLEIFRRNSSRNGSVPSVKRLNSTGTCSSTTGLPVTSNLAQQRRPSTVCSTNTTSLDYTNRKKLHLPQVTFTSEKSSSNYEENKKKLLYQLISKEQQYATGLQFAVTRFVSALAERRDLITPAEHKILFQNSEEILRITEDILDSISHDDGEPQLNNILKVYKSKLSEMSTAYKRYCTGIKRADCVLANKTKNSNSEFVRFLQTPSIPRRRPDITAFIHKPLEHFREVLTLLTLIQTNTKSSHDDYSVINQLVHDLQLTYKEITSEAGLMEPLGEGRPLLTVQDLENRLVFTKCKPFVLNKPGRHWIFGGDLGRVEGRNVRQYWTLLFNDLLLFAKVSRDRVLFIMEDPLPLAHVSDLFFNIRKKDTEFRIIITPGGKNATSPTVHCGPDLTRTPKKNAAKRTVILRAPTIEMKAVWQNLLQRQIFHINAGMDGSSFSSPLESPDAPITSSVATLLQSAESLSFRRQTPQNLSENSEMQKQIDALIENKCKQLTKNNSSKGNATHLEKWMKSQLDVAEQAEMEPLAEEWTEEMLRKRSKELHLIDSHGNVTCCSENRREENTLNEDQNLSDHDQSPSKSTTTESQVTVRSSPLVPETVQVCRQCHKNCLSSNGIKVNNNKDVNDNANESDDWRPFLLMGLSAINPAASFVKLDPFCTPVPQINVAPPTPENLINKTSGHCSCQNSRPDVHELNLSNDLDFTPDDSPQTEEHPYHSLSSSNLTLRRYGTVSSLERLEDHEENNDELKSSESESDNDDRGIDNEAFYQSSIKNWTSKAGSYVAEKMAFFERLGEDYRNSGRFFERYLRASDTTMNGDDLQEEETSGATSGEDIWGTPTSGGELDEPLSSPNYEGKQSPYDGSVSSDNGDDTELMMDELLMTPPISGAIMRGLLPRTTLEPLIEEDFSESCSSTSTGSPTQPSVSPEQGNGTGDVADTCSTAAGSQTNLLNSQKATIPSVVVTPESLNSPRIPRSESYRRIIEAAEDEVDALSFFDRFKPTIKFINIERVPRAKSAKIFEFFNMRRERRIHQTVPDDKQLVKLFSKEGVSESVSSCYAEKPTSPRISK